MTHEAHANPNPNPHDDPAPEPLFDVATISIIVFIAIVIMVTALYFQEDTRYLEQQYASGLATRQLFNQQDEQLATGLGWIDKNKGIAEIPIDDAMKIVAHELAAGKTGLPPQAAEARSERP